MRDWPFLRWGWFNNIEMIQWSILQVTVLWQNLISVFEWRRAWQRGDDFASVAWRLRHGLGPYRRTTKSRQTSAPCRSDDRRMAQPLQKACVSCHLMLTVIPISCNSSNRASPTRFSGKNTSFCLVRNICWTLYLYSDDLNNRIFRYSDHDYLSSHQMVL